MRFPRGSSRYRHAWYALPMVMLAFIALGLFPVLLLITATGIAFGPSLDRSTRWPDASPARRSALPSAAGSGSIVLSGLAANGLPRVTRALNRNGTLAVFLVRKVPAPFTLVNIVIGASTVRYRDFILGTCSGWAPS